MWLAKEKGEPRERVRKAYQVLRAVGQGETACRFRATTTAPVGRMQFADGSGRVKVPYFDELVFGLTGFSAPAKS